MYNNLIRNVHENAKFEELVILKNEFTKMLSLWHPRNLYVRIYGIYIYQIVKAITDSMYYCSVLWNY